MLPLLEISERSVVTQGILHWTVDRTALVSPALEKLQGCCPVHVMAVMKARFIYRNLKARFRDQRQEITALLHAAGSGETVVDVGANKGSYLYWMSRAVGRGRVVAFEPQPNLAVYLRKVVVACDLRNVTVEEKAASERCGTMILHMPGGGGSPGASLEDAVRSREACGQIEVETVKLDDYFAGCSRRISVIKVDAEGHEFSVFRGAERILLEHSPLLIFEAENRHLSRGTVFDVLNYLRGLRYDGFLVCQNSLVPIDRFVPEIHQSQVGERFWDRPSYCNNFIMKRANAQ
jgi:FkbM family methyltransferase